MRTARPEAVWEFRSRLVWLGGVEITGIIYWGTEPGPPRLRNRARFVLHQTAPPSKHQARQLFGTRRVGVRINGLGHLARSPASLVFTAPFEDHGRRHLQMKLQAVDAIAKPKCLVAADCGRGQQFATRREIERLAVPVKGVFRATQSLEERVAAGRIRERDRRPSDLLNRVLVDTGAEGFGDQLRAQADAE